MAHVSLRPVREDLAAADSAVETLVRTLGGGVPTAATTASARYADERKEIRWEVRSAVAGAPGVRLLRIEMRAFRSTAGPPGGPASLAYSTGTEPPRPVPPGAWLELEPAPRGVTVVQAWAEPAAAGPVRAVLRPVAFERLEVASRGAADDVMVTVVLDGRPGIEIPLAVRLPPPRLARVTVPRYALYFASRPGTVTLDPEGESWEASRGRWRAASPGSGAEDPIPAQRGLRSGAWLSLPAESGNRRGCGRAGGARLVLVRRPRPRSVEGS